MWGEKQIITQIYPICNQIYSSLDPTALTLQSRTSRLGNVCEIKSYFLSEIDKRNCLVKKIKRCNTIIYVLKTWLVTTTIVEERSRKCKKGHKDSKEIFLGIIAKDLGVQFVNPM